MYCLRGATEGVKRADIVFGSHEGRSQILNGKALPNATILDVIKRQL